MTREHKLALVVGFGLILFVGILITDHLAADTRLHEPLPTARIPDTDPISLLGRDTTRLISEDPSPAPLEYDAAPRVPEIVLDPSLGEARTPARPMRAVEPGRAGTVTTGPLAGLGMATPPAATERVHVVRKNETLSGIAKTVYGDAGSWRRIANANPRVDPDRLRPGTRLRIPADEPAGARPAAAREVPAPVAASRPATRSYTVRKGDALADIAKRELGSERRWREIKTLNGLRNEIIHPGQTLVLPGR